MLPYAEVKTDLDKQFGGYVKESGEFFGLFFADVAFAVHHFRHAAFRAEDGQQIALFQPVCGHQVVLLRELPVK